MTKNLTNNFANAGYREAAIKREQLGDEGFRTVIIDDGKAMLRTKGGMPRVTPLVQPKAPCTDTISPLTETAAADREYWEPTGVEADERVFSIDGLLSLPKRVVKTIKTMSSGASARTVSIRFAHGGTPAVVRPGDMVEESRTLGTRAIPAWFKCGLAFVSTTCVESIKFNMGNCPVALNFKVKLTDPAGAHGGITGAYDSTSLTPLAFGASSLDFVFNGKRLSINFDAGQTFLEPYSYKVALALRGGELLPKEKPDDVMPGAFFSMDKWGSPLKGFAHSTGLYVDETRRNKITKPDPKTFPFSAGESYPARYFNFKPLNDDVFIEGTECSLRHDIQFNGGYSYPGSSYADTGTVYLSADEHLYRDGTGAIWRIRFSMAPVSEHVVSVTARLVERVDTFLDDAGAAVIPRDIVTQQFSPMVADNYTPSPGFNGMYVDSLPNGTEASIAINAPQGDNIMNPRDPEVSRILKCVFSGNGGATGAGVSMTFEQLRTVTRYQISGWTAGPLVSLPDPPAVLENEVPSMCCLRAGKYWNPATHAYEWGAGPVCISPDEIRSLKGNGAFGYIFDFITTRAFRPPIYSSRGDWFMNVNIQLVARADNTWDMVVMEYHENGTQEQTGSIAKDIYSGFFYYCADMNSKWFDTEWNQGQWPFVRTERRNSANIQSDNKGIKTTCTLKYTCGEHSIMGFTEHVGGGLKKSVVWDGQGDYTPEIDLHGAFYTNLTAETTRYSSMKTPFWSKQRTSHRVETAHNSASHSAPYDGNQNWTDTGYVDSGDPVEELFWMNIYPRFVAGNKHTIEYNAQDGYAVPPHNVDELIHGIAVLNRPATGYKACDDPRNTRIVLLPTADAGLFF